VFKKAKIHKMDCTKNRKMQLSTLFSFVLSQINPPNNLLDKAVFVGKTGGASIKRERFLPYSPWQPHPLLIIYLENLYV
jgi:hypothetical protein